jgi:hypothetical protein
MVTIRLDGQPYPSSVHVMSTDQVTGIPDSRTDAIEVSMESSHVTRSIRYSLQSPWYAEVTIYASPGHANLYNVDAPLLSLVNNRRTTMVRLVQVRFHLSVLLALMLSQVETVVLECCDIDGDLDHLLGQDNEDEE